MCLAAPGPGLTPRSGRTADRRVLKQGSTTAEAALVVLQGSLMGLAAAHTIPASGGLGRCGHRGQPERSRDHHLERVRDSRWHELHRTGQVRLLIRVGG